MSHTEYIIDDSEQGLSAYDFAWATISVVVLAACVYVYVLPRIRKKPKTF